MGTAVTTLSLELSRRLADEVSTAATDGEQFTSAQRTAALNAAHKQMVIHVLSATNKRKSAYTLLGSLTRREHRSLGPDGFDLSGLSRTVAAGGIINVECLIGTARVYGVERGVEDLQYANNEHFQGNDNRPVYYLQGDELWIEVNLGSYPVDAYVHYVENPKELSLTADDTVHTSTIQTSPTLDEPILQAAVAVAQQLGDDLDKVQVATQSALGLIQGVIAHEFGKQNKRNKGEA